MGGIGIRRKLPLTEQYRRRKYEMPASHSAVRRTLAGRGEPRAPSRKSHNERSVIQCENATDRSLSAVLMTSTSGYTAKHLPRNESEMKLLEYTWDSTGASAPFQQTIFIGSGEWILPANCGMIVGREVTAAMKLQDLYYGNVTPCEHNVKSESEYAKRTRDLLEMCESLRQRPSADDKKLLNNITDMQGMLSETMAAESYIQGFRDCAELIIDVMFGSSENLK